ncbi:hypothetical protein STEG23_022822, partial [Scotinomys teguina]
MIGRGSAHLLPSVIGEKCHDDSQGIHHSDLWVKPAQFRKVQSFCVYQPAKSLDPVLEVLRMLVKFNHSNKMELVLLFNSKKTYVACILKITTESK